MTVVHLVGKISPVSKWRTGLMPKAWAMNITMAMSRGTRPKMSCTCYLEMNVSV